MSPARSRDPGRRQVGTAPGRATSAPSPSGAPDAARLLRAVGALARSATEDLAVEDVLRDLCEVAAEALDVDGVGVMAMESSPGVVARTDGSGRAGHPVMRVVHASRSSVRVLEALQESLQSGPGLESVGGGAPIAISDLGLEGDWPEFQTAAVAADLGAVLTLPLLSRGLAWGTLDLFRRTGRPWTTDETSAAQLLADVAVSYLVMTADRDAARSAQAELARRSLQDELTGLANRTLFFERLEHTLVLGRRRGTTVAVVYIDVDGFKQVNDVHGHATGDHVLVEAGRRMASTLRESDTLARLAGDELALICEDLPASSVEAQHVVDVVVARLHEALAPPFELADGGELHVTASIGAATSTPESTPTALLHAADTAMYVRKRRRRPLAAAD